MLSTSPFSQTSLYKFKLWNRRKHLSWNQIMFVTSWRTHPSVVGARRLRGRQTNRQRCLPGPLQRGGPASRQGLLLLSCSTTTPDGDGRDALFWRMLQSARKVVVPLPRSAATIELGNQNTWKELTSLWHLRPWPFPLQAGPWRNGGRY